MTDVVSFDPKCRHGKTAERWGNVLLPEGGAEVDGYTFGDMNTGLARSERISVRLSTL